LLSFGCVRRDAILRGCLLLGDFRLCELIVFAGRFGFFAITQHAAVCDAGTCVGEDFARVGSALSRSRWLWRRSWCRYRFGCWGGWFCRSFLDRLGGLADLIGWRGGLLGCSPCGLPDCLYCGFECEAVSAKQPRGVSATVADDCRKYNGAVDQIAAPCACGDGGGVKDTA